MVYDETVHTESTTAQQISKETDVPSHGAAVDTDTDMKNGTKDEILERKDAIENGMLFDLTSADTEEEI